MIYGFIVDGKEGKPCGYFPSHKKWHVRYSISDANGLMMGVIVRDGKEIAIRATPSTMEELIYFADAYMAREEA